MHNRDYLDLGRLLDQIFKATEQFTNSFGTYGFEAHKNTEHKNYYSLYPFPPANIYMLNDKTMVLEFALAGYRDSDVSLEFQGDYMVLSAKAPEAEYENDEVIYFNRRLKFKELSDQRYFVPEDKFDRDSAKAVFRNGILKVAVPAREEVKNPAGVKIEIVNEDE